MASLRGLDHIGEKIFKFHQGKDILNFRLVCQSWKHILENPMYWLKKLNKIGQSKKVFNETLILIRKAFESGIPETKIGHCLLIKYLKITEIRSNKDFAISIKKKLTNLMLRLPVLYCALVSKKPDLELIGFLAKTQFNVAKPVKCPPGIKYIRGRFSKYYARKSFEFDPLKDTIEGNHDLKVIEILVSELKDQISNQQFQITFKLTVMNENLEICKLIGENIHVFKDFIFEGANSIRMAIQKGNIEILRYLIFKMKETFKTANPITEIIFCCWHLNRNDSSKVHSCPEMAKIISHKMERINWRIVETIDKIKKESPCAIEILNIIVPLCNFQYLNPEYFYAQYSKQVCEILKPFIGKNLKASSPPKKKLKRSQN